MTHLVLIAALLARAAAEAAQTPVPPAPRSVPINSPSSTVTIPASTAMIPITVAGLPIGCVWTVTGGAQILVTVTGCPSLVPPPPTFAITTPVTLPGGKAGQPYTLALAPLVLPHGGVPPYTFAADPNSFPAWLTLSPQGLLTGTPPAAGTFTLQFTVTDSSITLTKGGLRAPSIPLCNAAAITIGR